MTPNLQILMVAGAIFLILFLLIAAFSGPSVGKAQDRRLSAVKDRHSLSTESAMAAQMRKTIASRGLSNNNNKLANLLPNKALMETRLRKTGKKIPLANYMIVNMAIVVVVAGLLILKGAPILLGLFIGLIMGLGLPHMYISGRIKKRIKKFNDRFPDAIDLLVRGLRSGLPISETLGVVSAEIPGPVGEEFKLVTERIKIGKTMDMALQESAEMINTAEFQFFGITLAIQRETGGNLAETLSNLSEVLRKRAQMVLKIKAMSSEAKASAYIVGALPFFVFGIVSYMNPDYVAGFFTETRLMIAGGGALGWMGIGVFIMKQMISFEI
jgi:tight adherence protein B